MMNYQDCVDYILSIPLFAVKLGTENLNRILDVMGHPERTAPVIHVAGTNGKGSTCSFLSSILTAKGFKTGVFTSPHLININERIRIGTEEISNDDFVAVFEEVMRVVKVVEEDGMAHPSFFEFMFLMAAVYFKKQDVDYAIYETGMGGRLDATNVVKPELCIITSVGMDHMQFLGDTIEQIAEEKAGIIKQGVPVVYFHRNFTVKDIIEKYCKKMGAVLHIVEKTQYNLLKITNKTIDFSFNSGYYRYSSLQIRKTALYQIENAILAVRAYELLIDRTNGDCNCEMTKSQDCSMINRDIDIIKTGLYSMVWPCRMECISEHIYVDGAHNEEAIEAFCKTLEVMFQAEEKILFFAVSKDKNYEKMIERLCRIEFLEIILVQYEGSRAAELAAIYDTFRRFSDSSITIFEDISEGFSYAREHVKDQYLFCVGSLYLAGNLLRLGV